MFLYNNPIFIAAQFIILLFIAFRYKGMGKTLKSLVAFLAIALLIIIINPLTNHRGSNILFYFMDNPITLESILYGVYNALLIITLLCVFISFNVLIDSERFLYIFSKLSPKLAFITSMSLRFTSVFKKRAADIIDVQATKGMSIKKGSLIERLKTAGMFLVALTSWCLEDTMGIAESLKAKEYGSRERSNYKSYKFIFYDGCLIIVELIGIFLAILFSSYGAGQYNFYPRLTSIVMSSSDVLAFVSMLLFFLIPIITELPSDLKRGLNNGYN